MFLSWKQLILVFSDNVMIQNTTSKLIGLANTIKGNKAAFEVQINTKILL